MFHRAWNVSWPLWKVIIPVLATRAFQNPPQPMDAAYISVTDGAGRSWRCHQFLSPGLKCSASNHLNKPKYLHEVSFNSICYEIVWNLSCKNEKLHLFSLVIHQCTSAVNETVVVIFGSIMPWAILRRNKELRLLSTATAAWQPYRMFSQCFGFIMSCSHCDAFNALSK